MDQSGPWKNRARFGGWERRLFRIVSNGSWQTWRWGLKCEASKGSGLYGLAFLKRSEKWEGWVFSWKDWGWFLLSNFLYPSRCCLVSWCFFGMIVWLFVCQKRANRVILLVETAMSLQPNQFNPFAKQCSTFKRHLKVPALLQPTLPPWHAGGDTKASRPWSCQVRVTSKFRLWWQMLGSYAPG